MSLENMAQMDRRSLMARALWLVGASAAASACQSMDAMALVPPAAANEALTAQQSATLAAMADSIIPDTDTPGALAAGVPARLEGMLASWASPDTRSTFLRVLADVDALPGEGRSFAALSATERHTLLAAHDAAAMAPSGQTSTAFISSRALPVDPGYGRLKDLIVTLYFMSETALTQELVYEHVPGTWQPSIPVTPETRPWGDVSNF